MSDDLETGGKFSAEIFDRDYFECGLITGISCYMHYTWMPEMTLRMAHYYIRQLPIEKHHTVLDFGCAKGFLVKALRILDINAYGVDISCYAIESADGVGKPYCTLISGCDDSAIFVREYDWLIGKDVFEHIPAKDLRVLLERAHGKTKRIFAVIPLAADDDSGKFIIPEYNRDITHILAKSQKWWCEFFEEMGWKVEQMTHQFTGCKENWTTKCKDGNGFFRLSATL